MTSMKLKMKYLYTKRLEDIGNVYVKVVHNMMLEATFMDTFIMETEENHYT